MSDPCPSEESALEALVGQIADEFTQRLNRGEQPDVEEYARRYPALAELLRQVLPGLQLLRIPPPAGGRRVSVERDRLPATTLAPGPSEDPRVGRVVREYQAALEAGQQPARGELLALYPDLAGVLGKCLDALDLVHGAAHRLQPGSVGRPPLLAPTLDVPLGDFRILREVGRGGMGVVYEAEQVSLGRRVALKVLPFAAALDTRQRQRFQHEAQAAALLHHPNIVPVYAVGCERDVHYYTMQFIDGRTLAELIDRRRHGPDGEKKAPADQPALPASPADFFRTAARLGVQAAEALEHAHQLGVVHRDVKPANLLLDRQGNLWVTDFGLARVQSDVRLTMTGDLLGTLRYMSPEQALAKPVAVDHRTDVYALGATLYELLTLEPACTGNGRQEILRHIALEEPRPLRRVRSDVPAELEVIVLKALAKLPEERYGTARELADDLTRFLEDRPIRARPPSLWQRARKLARRHRGAVLASGISTVVLLVAAVCGLLASNRLLFEEQQRTHNALADAEQKKVEADQERQDAQDARREAEGTLTDMYTATGLMAGDRRDPAQAILWFATAARQARQDPERARANRARFRIWGRDMPLPFLAVPPRQAPLQEVRFDPTGGYLMVLDQAPRCEVWRLKDREPVPLPGGNSAASCADWHPQGDRLALGTPQGDVELVTFPEGKRLEHWQLAGKVQAVAFSADGHYLAMATDRVRVWDCQARRFATPELPHPRPVRHLVFNAHGDRLATACSDGLVRLFAVPGEAEPLLPPLQNLGRSGRSETPVKPVFLDQDRGLLLRTRGGAVWCDARTGQELRTVSGGNVNLLLASPDGRYFVVCEEYSARFWDVAAARAVGPPMAHRDAVIAAFGPDSQQLVAASWRECRLWSVPGGEAVTAPLMHQDHITHTAFSPDGRSFATAQLDGLVRIWKCPRGNADDRRIVVDGERSRVALSPDARRLIPTGAGWGPRRTRVYEVASGTPVGPALDVGGRLLDAALAPDGRTAVTVVSTGLGRADWYSPVVLPEGRAGRLQFWDYTAGEARFPAVPLPSDPRAVAFSPDGACVVALCGGGQVLVLDPTRGQVLRRLAHQPVAWSENRFTGVRFAPDGQSFVTFAGPEVKAWETAGGRCRFTLALHGPHCLAACFSPDGRFLATATGDESTVHVRDARTGDLLAKPLLHPSGVFAVSFSADGSRLLTACGDGMARLLAWRTGALICPPFKCPDAVVGAALSPDGRWVLTAGRDATLRFWEVRTGKALSPAYSLGVADWYNTTLFFTPDGARAVAGSQGRGIPLFSLGDLREPEDLDPDDLLTLAELATGYRVVGGDVSGLTTPEWLERWRRFTARQPHHGLTEPEPPFAWHQQEARRYELARNASGALWHLDRLLALAPANAELFGRRGQAHAQLAHQDQAVADFTAALRQTPEVVEYYAGRAAAHVARGDDAAAVADFTEVLRRAPRNAVAYLQRGNACFRQKVYDRALADQTTALRLDPTYTEAYASRGETHLQQREFAKAVADFTQALEFEPGSPTLRARLDQAVADFNEARRLDPGPRPVIHGTGTSNH